MSLDEWRRVVSSTFLPLDATVDGDERFRGSLEGVANDQVAVMGVGLVAQQVSRSAAGCRRSPAEFRKVLVQRSGGAVVEQDGHHGVLAPRTLGVYETARPYQVTQRMPFTTDVVLMPRRWLPLSRQTLAGILESPVCADSGAGAVFVACLDSLRDRLGETSAPATVWIGTRGWRSATCGLGPRSWWYCPTSRTRSRRPTDRRCSRAAAPGSSWLKAGARHGPSLATTRRTLEARLASR